MLTLGIKIYLKIVKAQNFLYKLAGTIELFENYKISSLKFDFSKVELPREVSTPFSTVGFFVQIIAGTIDKN